MRPEPDTIDEEEEKRLCQFHLPPLCGLYLGQLGQEIGEKDAGLVGVCLGRGMMMMMSLPDQRDSADPSKLAFPSHK